MSIWSHTVCVWRIQSLGYIYKAGGTELRLKPRIILCIFRSLSQIRNRCIFDKDSSYSAVVVLPAMPVLLQSHSAECKLLACLCLVYSRAVHSTICEALLRFVLWHVCSSSVLWNVSANCGSNTTTHHTLIWWIVTDKEVKSWWQQRWHFHS